MIPRLATIFEFPFHVLEWIGAPVRGIGFRLELVATFRRVSGISPAAGLNALRGQLVRSIRKLTWRSAVLG